MERTSFLKFQHTYFKGKSTEVTHYEIIGGSFNNISTEAIKGALTKKGLEGQDIT